MKKYIFFISLFLFLPFGSFANASTFTPATLTIPFTQNMIFDFGDRVFFPYFVSLTNCELGVIGYFGGEGVPEDGAGCNSGGELWKGTIKSLTGEVILGTAGGEVGGMGGTFFLYGYWFSLTGGGGGILTLGSIADIFAPVGILVSDLWILLAIAIGIPLAFYIIKRLIALMPKK